LKSDDPAFQIVASGYIEQTVTEIGEGDDATITSEFEPMILVQSNYQITKCSVSGGVMTMQGIEGTNGLAWQTISALPSSTIPSETYAITAANADNEAASYTVSFSSITKEMKNKLKCTTMDYNPQTKQLTFEFNKVENATEYLLIARVSESASLYQSAIIESYTAVGEKVLEEAYFAKNLASGTYTLTIVAITGTSSNGNFGVIQEGKSTRYTKGE
jgi:hypothetical protein